MNKRIKKLLLMLVVLAVNMAVTASGQSVENRTLTINLMAVVGRYANVSMATGIHLDVDKWDEGIGWDEEDVHCEIESNYNYSVGFLLLEYMDGELPDPAWLYLRTPYNYSTTNNPTHQAIGSTGPFTKGITILPSTGKPLTSVQVGIDGITLADDVKSYGIVGELQITLQPKP